MTSTASVSPNGVRAAQAALILRLLHAAVSVYWGPRRNVAPRHHRGLAGAAGSCWRRRPQTRGVGLRKRLVAKVSQQRAMTPLPLTEGEPSLVSIPWCS